MIPRKYEVKTKLKHISCDCNCKINSTACNLNQKWNNNMSSIERAKKIILRILAHALVSIAGI